MNKKTAFHSALLAAGMIWLLLIAARSLVETIKQPTAPHTVYDRVMENGTIRCGYVLYPPAVIKDPNSGKFSGIAVEVMEKIAARLQLKIEWAEETSFATNVEGLRTGRYDAVCITYWANPGEGRYAGFSIPFYYSGLVAGQKCPASGWNYDTARIAAIDGSVASRVIAARFPKAEIVGLPNMTDVSQLLMNVATGKADMAFAENYQFAAWNKNNPDQQLCTAEEPLTVYPNTIALPLGDDRFKSMIDAALTDLINSGEIDAILDRWEEDYPKSFYRVAKPYR